MLSSKFPISIIIPTYNGKEKIIHLLNELAKQSYQLFETIIVVDGSNDGTAEALESMGSDLRSLKVIEQENAGRAGARNSGGRAATSDILLFIDDDMSLTENFIEEHLKVHQQHDIVVGILEALNDGVNPEILEYASYMNQKANLRIFGAVQKPLGTPYITAGNFSIKKDIFYYLNGFDSRLNDAEDFELAVRCKENGYTIHYSDKCLLFHPLPASLLESVRRPQEYRIGRAQLLKYHPELEKYISSEKNTISVYKKPFFYLFSFRFWLILADKNVFKILPRPLRFKLFDILQTANFHY